MNDDFTTAPPSRSVRRPELAGMTEEERREEDRRALWGVKKWEPQPSQWLPGAPSDPAILRLLEYAHSPSGQPLPPGRFREPPPPRPNALDEEVAAFQALRHRLVEQHKTDDEEHMVRFHFWIGLDVCQKSQLAADVHNRQQPAGTPLWLTQCVTDGTLPPIVLAANDPGTAVREYRRLLGIIEVPPQPGGQEGIIASPYTPPETNGNGDSGLLSGCGGGGGALNLTVPGIPPPPFEPQ